MKISFIGAGKVGTAFGKYLSSHYEVAYINDLNQEQAKLSATYIGCQLAENDKLVAESDVIFLTVSDNFIYSLAGEIAAFDVKDKLFVHMSGALTSEELRDLKNKGAKTCSMHPLQTFSDTEKAVEDLKEAYFAVEGDDDLVESMIKKLGNPYFKLDKSQKNKYHLSACIFSNYLVTLMNYGSRMMADIGIKEEDALKAMKPLIDATLSNIMLKGTEQSLTGPIQRGDTKTVEKHMTELNGVDLEAYQLLGRMTTDELIMNDDIKSILNAIWREQ
jgi:predicted short-subunit dehydrogenase-like oxidoreductase (DUF2520 family)